VLHGLTREVTCGTAGLSPGALELCVNKVNGTVVFYPDYVGSDTALYKSLAGQSEMLSWGLDLAKRPIEMIGEGFTTGFVYALLVIALGFLYFVQQRMVAARASVSPTMSETQQKLMQYLPVVFAVFLVFYLTGLVIYYMAQAIIRIGLQWYITKRFYKGEHSLGQQAMKAGATAREMSKAEGGGGGMFAQAKRDMAASKDSGKSGSKSGSKAQPTPPPAVSKRVTPPKNKPTPSGQSSRPPSSGKSTRPTPPTKK
jgi:YidC/Oxa1 family membrane protein insertase